MSAKYSVAISKIINEFTLDTLYLPNNTEELYVSSADLNRPGLQLVGYFKYFDESRIQIIGLTEIEFLKDFEEIERKKMIDLLFMRKPPAVIITRSLDFTEEMLEAAKKHNVPFLRCHDLTSEFMSALISYLNIHLAHRITRHGVMVEVYGEGILILGESGIGKSETAIELLKRGHRLIADDAVEIRKVSSKTLIGSAPDNIRHFMEVRGIGIINARRIFGMASVKLTEKIDFILNLETWDSQKVYDRMGLENEMTEILGLDIPSITVPVKPGRNLAVIIEVAAMNNRQKKMGYNAADELLIKLGLTNDISTNDKKNKAHVDDIF